MKQPKDSVETTEQRRTARSASGTADAKPIERERANPSPPAIADAHPAVDRAQQGNDPLAHAADLARNGDLAEAATAYRTYLTRHPEDVPARRGLSGVLEQNGDFVGALGELGRAIDAQPDDVSLLCGRAAV